MCKNSIPCDKCHIRRLPHFFDLKNSFETSVDTLECVFCKGSESALDKEETYIYSCLTLIFRQLFNHACKNYGQPMLCQDCDMFFMSKPIEDGKEKSQCYCCKLKL